MSESIKVTTKPTGAGAVAGKEILVDGIWKATVVERFVAGCVASIERDVNPPAETSAPLETGATADCCGGNCLMRCPPAAPAATPRTDIIEQLNGALMNSMGEDFQISAAFVRDELIPALTFWRDENADLRGKLEQARRTAEYWKAEHLAGNKAIETAERQRDEAQKDAERWNYVERNPYRAIDILRKCNVHSPASWAADSRNNFDAALKEASNG